MTRLLRPPLQARGQLLNLYQPKTSDGCVLWLPGQDDAYSSTIRDRSGNGNDGTVKGATWVKNTRGLWCLDFDGSDDRIAIGSNLTKAVTALTIKAWVNVTDLSAHQAVYGDYTDTGDASVQVHIRDQSVTSTWGARFYLKGENVAYSSLNAGTLTLAYGQWYCFACVWNGTTREIFINGQTDGSGAYVDTSLEQTVTENTTIGAYKDAASASPFKGRSALFLICNTAFSSDRILSSFNSERHLFGV